MNKNKWYIDQKTIREDLGEIEFEGDLKDIIDSLREFLDVYSKKYNKLFIERDYDDQYPLFNLYGDRKESDKEKQQRLKKDKKDKEALKKKLKKKRLIALEKERKEYLRLKKKFGDT